MTSKKPKSIDFEASIASLNTLVESMEQGNLPLEESLANFEKGIKLIRECQSALNQAEQKVKKLTSLSESAEHEDFEAVE